MDYCFNICVKLGQLPPQKTKIKYWNFHQSIAHLISLLVKICVVGLNLQQEEHSKVENVNIGMNYSVQSTDELQHRIFS